jgi:hypothetical protein
MYVYVYVPVFLCVPFLPCGLIYVGWSMLIVDLCGLISTVQYIDRTDKAFAMKKIPRLDMHDDDEVHSIPQPTWPTRSIIYTRFTAKRAVFQRRRFTYKRIHPGPLCMNLTCRGRLFQNFSFRTQCRVGKKEKQKNRARGSPRLYARYRT